MAVSAYILMAPFAHTTRLFVALSCYGVFERPGIFYPLGRLKNFDTNNISILVVIDNHTRFVFIAFLDGLTAEQNT
ncbi:MAG: hypothetical protein AUK26_13105 [Syntrophaceae bacterium CG2_30_58_14]|nr:MAG: hypothetical protein AUK26_13105 [Syntrophaceae bacterium CG2_30_58_14]